MLLRCARVPIETSECHERACGRGKSRCERARERQKVRDREREGGRELNGGRIRARASARSVLELAGARVYTRVLGAFAKSGATGRFDSPSPRLDLRSPPSARESPDRWMSKDALFTHARKALRALDFWDSSSAPSEWSSLDLNGCLNERRRPEQLGRPKWSASCVTRRSGCLFTGV